MEDVGDSISAERTHEEFLAEGVGLLAFIVSLKPRPLAVDQKRFDRSVVYS